MKQINKQKQSQKLMLFTSIIVSQFSVVKCGKESFHAELFRPNFEGTPQTSNLKRKCLHNMFLLQLQLLELRTTNYELDAKCKKQDRGLKTSFYFIMLFLC